MSIEKVYGIPNLQQMEIVFCIYEPNFKNVVKAHIIKQIVLFLSFLLSRNLPKTVTRVIKHFVFLKH